eukprot:SAG31_NODE_267_length_18790_cov_3.661655_9_plen_130_part_00
MQRLGCHGVPETGLAVPEDFALNDFFKFDWDQLLSKEIQPPYVQSFNEDPRHHFDKKLTSQDAGEELFTSPSKNKLSKDPFVGFYFDRDVLLEATAEPAPESADGSNSLNDAARQETSPDPVGFTVQES